MTVREVPAGRTDGRLYRECCWCGVVCDGAAWSGHPICDPCWDAGADGWAPDCFGECAGA